MPRIVHFEIPADKPEKAVEFYKKVFGWDIQKYGDVDYWLVTTGKDSEMGINGAIMKKMDNKGVRNTAGVANLDESVNKVVAAGGKIIAPKMPVMGFGWLAYCEDNQGNIFGMMQMDKNAK